MMSEETRQPITRTAASLDTGGLMSSIAAVREILMMNTASETKVISELQNIKQTSYRQKLHLEEELETQKALIKELRSKVTQGQEEVQREKTLRQALETAHTSLEEHKKELLSQLEKAINARLTLEAKLVAFRVDLEKENDEFEKERTKWEDLVRELRLQNEDTLKKSGELEARLLASQRQTKELDSSLAKLNKQVESTRVTRKATIQGYVNSNEKLRQLIELTNINSTGSMQERVEEAETARSVAVKKVRIIF
jgi:chromosome segregation ATPase